MNIYQTITDHILRQLESGTVPWRKTWTTGLPKSLTTGDPYRGVNILLLGLREFASRYWVTYRQAQRLGGQVRRGEKASLVVYWKWRTHEELQELAEKMGRDHVCPCYPFTSAVFNLDQVEGLTRPDDDVPLHNHERLEMADQIFQAMPDKPETIHAAGQEPAYHPALDRITLPHLSQFESADQYYGALYHEATHASGAKKRLNRFGDVPGDRFERYSFEELVAEFGAAFLCACAGIHNPANDALQAGYIAGWSQALRRDGRLILRAASAAQQAADYIRGQPPAEQRQHAAVSIPTSEGAEASRAPGTALSA